MLLLAFLAVLLSVCISTKVISCNRLCSYGDIPLSNLILCECCLQLGAIVGEKESGLVTSLRHMGLLQSSYWLSWVSFDLLMGLATALSIVMWGKCVWIEWTGLSASVWGLPTTLLAHNWPVNFPRSHAC